jgi:hypothetical protein
MNDYEKALVIREKVLPPKHPSLANTYASIAQTYFEMGDHGNVQFYMMRSFGTMQRPRTELWVEFRKRQSHHNSGKR